MELYWHIDRDRLCDRAGRHLVRCDTSWAGPHWIGPHRMSARLQVFVWVVIAALVIIWLLAIWYVVFQPGPLPFLPVKPS